MILDIHNYNKFLKSKSTDNCYIHMLHLSTVCCIMYPPAWKNSYAKCWRLRSINYIPLLVLTQLSCKIIALGLSAVLPAHYVSIIYAVMYSHKFRPQPGSRPSKPGREKPSNNYNPHAACTYNHTTFYTKFVENCMIACCSCSSLFLLCYGVG